MPLEFLRRKGSGTPSSKAAAPEPPSPPPPVPEEAVAQEHQLRLTFGAKTSAGVRIPGGPQVLAALPRMLDGVAITDVEVVEARDTTLGSASPAIVRTEEATEWLRAHGALSPITRHALFVLESMDAIDPAYDTFACGLLDGEVDPAGYPEYASIVGGVAAHWDEGTGDLIVRAVVGWGGRGTRGDTDRTASKLLGRLLGNILESGQSIGIALVDRRGTGGLAGSGAAITCQHCGYANVQPGAAYCPKCGMRILHS